MPGAQEKRPAGINGWKTKNIFFTDCINLKEVVMADDCFPKAPAVQISYSLILYTAGQPDINTWFWFYSGKQA